MKDLTTILIIFTSYVSVLILAATLPFLTRRNSCFGISIPPELFDREDIKGIRKQYGIRIIAGGLLLMLAAAVLAFTLDDRSSAMALTAGIFAEIGLMYVVYISAHMKVKALKASESWSLGKQQMLVVDTGFRKKRTTVSPLWFAAYAVIAAATLAAGVLMYDSIPDRVPMHFDAAGQVDRWVNKSYGALLWIPAVQLIMTAVMMLSYWSIGKAKQQIDASQPEKTLEQNRRFRYAWSVFVIVTGIVLMLMFGLFQLYIIGLLKNPAVMSTIPAVITFGIVAGAIVLSFKTGQGGSRIYVASAGGEGSAEAAVVNRDEDRYWKLGMFYYNPDDPSLFIEKRFGIGWTNNWARPLSWVILLAILAGIPLLMKLIEKMTL